jgi:hypothetical protein
MADRLNKYLAGLFQIAAGVQHSIDLGPVLGPFMLGTTPDEAAKVHGEEHAKK